MAEDMPDLSWLPCKVFQMKLQLLEVHHEVLRQPLSMGRQQ